MVIEFEEQDAILIVMSLLITDTLLFRSRYDPDLKATLARNIKSIIDRIHQARAHNPNTDAQTEEGFPGVRPGVDSPYDETEGGGGL